MRIIIASIVNKTILISSPLAILGVASLIIMLQYANPLLTATAVVAYVFLIIKVVSMIFADTVWLRSRYKEKNND